MVENTRKAEKGNVIRTSYPRCAYCGKEIKLDVNDYADRQWVCPKCALDVRLRELDEDEN